MEIPSVDKGVTEAKVDQDKKAAEKSKTEEKPEAPIEDDKSFEKPHPDPVSKPEPVSEQ